jgi:hypothetical protein
MGLLNPLKPVPVQQSAFAFTGGLDLVSPATQLRPGVCIDSGGFTPDINGGYTRIGGYERFDGHTAPSSATYSIAVVASSAGLAVGNTVTGGTSGATGKVLVLPDATTAVLGRVVGTFTPGESLLVSAVPITTLTSISLASAATLYLNAVYNLAAADDLRTDISAVPGSGSVLGVWLYNGGVPALSPSGTYRFVNYNFTGSATGLKMYGCDGVNKAFEFDGTTFTQITSTAAPDTPAHVVAHKNRLFLAVKGSLFVSSPGAPTAGWAGVGTTPAEIGIGDTITGMLSLPGDATTGALATYARNKTAVLYGASTSTWNLVVVAPDAGALAGTTQYVSAGLGLDDRGVTQLSATADFGNFAASSISSRVEPFISSRVGLAVASSVLRSQNQYRLYFTDGYALAFRVENGKNLGVMPFKYPNPVTCICSGETTDGTEVVYFGSTNGMVYQAERGTSFDGAEIEAWIRLAFNAERSANTRKHWRRLALELRVPAYARLYMAYEQDYGDYSIPVAAVSLEEFASTQETPGGGGFWDQFTWDEFTWDSPLINPPKYRLHGSSQNISPLFFSQDALSEPFTLQSAVLHYTPRRLQRS